MYRGVLIAVSVAVTSYLVTLGVLKGRPSPAPESRVSAAGPFRSARAETTGTPRPEPERSVESYGDVRDRLPCLPDDATMSPDALARTPFKDRERLKRFVAEHPAETMATFKRLNQAIGPAVREARACLRRTAGQWSSPSVQVTWTMHAEPTEIVLSNAKITGVPATASPDDIPVQCLSPLTRDSFRVRAASEERFVNYDGPYRATLSDPGGGSSPTNKSLVP